MERKYRRLFVRVALPIAVIVFIAVTGLLKLNWIRGNPPPFKSSMKPTGQCLVMESLPCRWKVNHINLHAKKASVLFDKIEGKWQVQEMMDRQPQLTGSDK